MGYFEQSPIPPSELAAFMAVAEHGAFRSAAPIPQKLTGLNGAGWRLTDIGLGIEEADIHYIA